jgi:predicted DCC family thiol-disulfide oxidoreductase YuxK
MSIEKKIVIIFDNDCLMCSSFIQFAYRLIKEFNYSHLSSDFSQNIISKNNLSNVDSIFFVDNDSVSYYSTAIIKIFLNSTSIKHKIFGFSLWLIPFPIRDIIYRLIAKKRLQISTHFENHYCDIEISKQIIHNLNSIL